MKENPAKEQRSAEDIAYTINHSLYCTLTDFLNPPINAATDNYLRWLIPGCGHDHGKDDPRFHGAACKHHHHEDAKSTRWEKVKKAARGAFSKERFFQYAKGEFIGDFGAVPLTIGVQRLMPGLMNGLRTVSQPIMRPIFTWGVERDNRKWAVENAIVPDSPEYKRHIDAIYEYEMKHFPQAIVWTGFSLGLNAGYQMWSDKTPMAFSKKFALKTTSVLSGVVVTAAAVVATRATMPDRMHRFDRWTGSNAILPATRAVGKVFGVRREAIDRMRQQAEITDGWSQRIEKSPDDISR